MTQHSASIYIVSTLLSLELAIAPSTAQTSPQPIPESPAYPVENTPGDREFDEFIHLLEVIILFQQGTRESYQQAIQKFEQALQFYRDNKNQAKEASTLLAIGFLHYTLEHHQIALEYYNQALPLMREVDDGSGEARTLNNMGLVYHALDQKQTALDYFNQALLNYQQLGEISGEATTLNNIGAVYNALGEKQRALDYFNQALPKYQEIEDRSGEATILNHIAKVYDDLGEKQTALDYYDRALPLLEQVEDAAVETTTLNNFGNVYHYREEQAATLSGIGSIYSDLGEKQKALDYYDRALRLWQEVGSFSGQAIALNNIGKIYDDLGEKQTALDYYHQALPLWQEAGNLLGQATSINNIGKVYDDLGEKQTALDYYNQALPLSKQIGDIPVEAATLNNISLVYDDLGQERTALAYLNQALPLLRQIGDRLGQAYIFNNIGKVYNDLGEKQRAIDYFNQALPLLRQVGNLLGEANTLSNLAWLQRDRGNLTEAKANIEAAIDIIENLRSKIDSETLRQSYFAQNQDAYEFYIDLLMELHEQNPESGYDAEAFNISERSRARILLELLAEAAADIRQGVDPELVEEERRIQQQLNAVEARRIELVSGKASEEQIAQAIQQRDAMIRQLDDIKTKIRRSSPRYAALTQPQPLTLEQVRQQAIDEDSLLLQYSLGEDRSFLWAVTKNHFYTYILPPRAEIEAAVQEFLPIITDPDLGQDETLLAETALPLTEMILSPAADLLNNKRLLVVPDGGLHYIPFATLAVPPKPGEFQEYIPLLVNHEIVNLPSSSTVGIIRQETQNRAKAPKKIAILANPVFDPEDSRLSGSPNPNTETAENQNLYLSIATRNFELQMPPPNLPFTSLEASEILALIPEHEALKALDFDANRDTLNRPDLSQYQIIHLATHGLADSQNPELSGLILSLVDERGNPIDGFIRFSDIFNLNLPAELVVLSACQTGLGETIQGEGMVGLTRGFMYAGSPRLVVSLWNVSDMKTADLMTGFYQNYLNEGLRPVEALRLAQLEFWNSQDWFSPYYWAAFTFQGEWR